MDHKEIKFKVCVNQHTKHILLKIGPLASKLVQANLALIQSLKDEYQSWVL
jgi:hypothetical protein